MEKHGIDDGHIININRHALFDILTGKYSFIWVFDSICGHGLDQIPEQHFYSATKHAVTILTQQMDMELKKED